MVTFAPLIAKIVFAVAHFRAIISIVCLLLCSASFAQAPHRNRARQTQTARLQQRYADSLAAYRDSLFADSVHLAPDSPALSSQHSPADAPRLFLPLAFYHSVTHNLLALSPGSTMANGRKPKAKDLPIDSTLMHVYLTRPDLVSTTETQLEQSGGVIAPVTIIETPTAIIEGAKPEDEEPEPITPVVLKPNFWTFRGDWYLQFLQNYISSNWYKGGESNYSMMGSVTIDFNYNNKQKVRWDNRLEMKLGMQTAKSDTLHKVKFNDNLLRYTGKLGLQATRRWYYTFQLVASTQFTRIYPTNSRTVQSDFMSPFNLNASVGMDYNIAWLKGRLRGNVHLAPFAYNFKYVDRLSLAQRNGIEKGKHALHDYGSQITVNTDWKFSNSISWKSRLYFYTSYKRTEAEWENTVSFQLSRFISTKLFLYPRFDDSRQRDDDLGYFQFKEYFSIGFSYSL